MLLCAVVSGLVEIVVAGSHCSSGVPGSGSWSAHAGSQTLTLVCAAWLVICNDATVMSVGALSNAAAKSGPIWRSSL